MTMVSFGDLAQSFLLKSQSGRLKQEAGRVTQELSSGRLSDIGAALSGDYSRLASLSRSRTVTEGYLGAAKDAAFQASAVQSLIADISDSVQNLVSPLLLAPQIAIGSQVALSSAEARERLDGVLATMNTSVAGRTLLAGVAIDGGAVVDADSLLTILRTEVSGAATAADVMTRISAWFDDPAGYAALGYQGGTGLNDLALSATDQVWLGTTANDAAFREVLKGLTAAALMTDATVALPEEDIRELARLSGEKLIFGQDALTDLGARIGISESRIEEIQSRNAAELLSLEMAQAEMVQGDPYRLAAELEAVQTNLETLYAVTARLSRLSLTDFL